MSSFNFRERKIVVLLLAVPIFCTTTSTLIHCIVCSSGYGRFSLTRASAALTAGPFSFVDYYGQYSMPLIFYAFFYTVDSDS